MSEPTPLATKQTPEQIARAAQAQLEYDRQITRAQDQGAEKALTMIRSVTSAAVDEMAERLGEAHRYQLEQTAAFHVERLNAYKESEADRVNGAVRGAWLHATLWLALPGMVLAAGLGVIATLFAVERTQTASFSAASEFGASQATIGAMIGTTQRTPAPCSYPNGLNAPGVTPDGEPCSYDANPFTQRRIAPPADAR